MALSVPLFSVVVPVFNPPVDVLCETIAAVQAQTFGDWEMILVDDGSDAPGVRDVLADAASTDERITLMQRTHNGGIVAASNDGLAPARGDFLVPVDHDDLVAPTGLQTVADAILDQPDVDYLYSDEDKLDGAGRFYDPFAKPELSPERLRGQAYTTHLSALRLELVRAVGGYRPGFDGSQDYDLILRVVERSRRVVHIPEVLYHWRVVPGSTAGDPKAKPYAWDAGRRAVQDHLARTGIRGLVHLGPRPGFYRTERFVDPRRRVSLVVPTAGLPTLIWGSRRRAVVETVRSVLARAGASVVDVVVVCPSEVAGALEADLLPVAGDRLRVLADAGEEVTFERSALAFNKGVAATRGEVLVLLDDDVEATSPRFLEQLVGPLDEPDVGATGPHCVAADGTLLDGGWVQSQDGWRPAFAGTGADDPGPFGALLISHEVSALGRSAVALRRSVWEDVGGLSEAVELDDGWIDLSGKLRAAGHRLVWVADARARRPGLPSAVPEIPAQLELQRRWSVSDRDVYLPDASSTG